MLFVTIFLSGGDQGLCGMEVILTAHTEGSVMGEAEGGWLVGQTWHCV